MEQDNKTIYKPKKDTSRLAEIVNTHILHKDKIDNTNYIKYKPHRELFFCTLYKDRSEFLNVLQKIDISDIQKDIIETRYLSILENFQRRTRNYSIVYYLGHFIVSVGSLLVPALMSIQNSDKNITFNGVNINIQMYWASFIISLLVSASTAVLSLLSVDKKFFFLTTTLERLRSEGWQYIGLTGRYSGHLIGGAKPTHTNQYVYFTHYIEKFKMKQIEEEYYKGDEKAGYNKSIENTQNNQSNTATTTPELYVPSPDRPINSMTMNVPEPVKQAVNTIIKSSRSLIPNSTITSRSNRIILPGETADINVEILNDNSIINDSDNIV
jgi:hypothetical protein